MEAAVGGGNPDERKYYKEVHLRLLETDMSVDILYFLLTVHRSMVTTM